MRWCFVIDSVPFTKAVRDGETSLGGSESSCLGLARALVHRGHQVYVFATKLEPAAVGTDPWNVFWVPYEQLDDFTRIYHWDVVVGLRMPAIFNQPIRASLRILWNQDLMNGEAYKAAIMAIAWNVDVFAYVSEFHRLQWEDFIPELHALGWATTNGFDPELVPSGVTKDPNRLIHISRPERGLEPLLQMWPAFRREHPEAELSLCRYSSMYDAQGWGEICKSFDAEVAKVQQDAGGITLLGELNKRDLYRAIAEAAVMWYPGVSHFAETSCIAAMEAQACGTPFVGSYKGALPETVPSGVLIPGDATSPMYQSASMAAVADLMKGCRTNAVAYRRLQDTGRSHVQRYTFAAVAEHWERYVEGYFEQRYSQARLGVLRQLAHEEDYTAAQIVAADLLDSSEDATERAEAEAISQLGDRIARGDTSTADNYAQHAMKPQEEIAMGGRIKVVAERFAGCTHVLDVACGNGSFAVLMAQKDPAIRVTGVDYSEANIAVARQFAIDCGVADRVTFICAPVWDFVQQTPSAWLDAHPSGVYDGIFVGEFVEHVTECSALIDALERVCQPGALAVYTCPSGPFVELLPRTIEQHHTHVHHFTMLDVEAVWGPKAEMTVGLMKHPHSPMGSLIGGWFITYRVSDAKAGRRPYDSRILRTRPRLRLSVGMLTHNNERDIINCLDSVWSIADEIVIADTGSTDTTKALLKLFPRKMRVVDFPSVESFEDGFAGARNAVRQLCTGEWFLWIDPDEVLAGSASLRMYLEAGGPYVGFALKQNHFQLDAPFHYDTPVRIFRNRPDIQFYGCVHEQPQMGDCNGDVHPALQLEDVQIAHFGYLVNGVREQKAFQRNRPLLMRDLERFPERRIGKLIALRQLTQDADHICAEAGQITEYATLLYERAVRLFRNVFPDPADKYHQLGRTFFEHALKRLGLGTEVEIAVAGRDGGLEHRHAKPRRYWVQDPADFAALWAYHGRHVQQQMTPATCRVDPYPVPEVEGVAV